MAHSTFVLLVSIALVVVVLAITALHWRRMRSVRTLLQGMGIALFIAGLQVIGFMEVVYTWARSTIHWATHTVFDGSRLVGLGIGGFGVVLFLIGMVISPVTRADARQRRVARKQAAAQVGTGVQAAGAGAGRSGGQAAAAPTRAPQAKSAPAGDEDAEVEAILRSHGIQ